MKMAFVNYLSSKVWWISVFTYCFKNVAFAYRRETELDGTLLEHRWEQCAREYASIKSISKMIKNMNAFKNQCESIRCFAKTL